MKYSCRDCGYVFEFFCQSELDRKIKIHKCHVPNKRVVRTAKLIEAVEDRILHNVAADDIQQHNFEKLVRQGIICCA